MKLRAHIDERGCTIVQAARGMKVPPATLRKWLAGTRNPSHEHMRLIYDWSLGAVTPDDLVLRGGRDGEQAKAAAKAVRAQAAARGEGRGARGAQEHDAQEGAVGRDGDRGLPLPFLQGLAPGAPDRDGSE